MTSISKDFHECNLQSGEVIEALKSGNQGVTDQVASKVYSNLLLGVSENKWQDAPDWPQKDEKLKWTLHSLVEVFGGILKTNDLVEQVKADNYEDSSLMIDLAYELKFLLLDLLGLYYELNYSTWNLIDLLKPDCLKEEQVTRYFKPALQPPPDVELMVGQQDNSNRAGLKQALTNWRYWSQSYHNLLVLVYDANKDDTLVAFHSLLAVSAQLISASHLGSLLLFSHARIGSAVKLREPRPARRRDGRNG